MTGTARIAWSLAALLAAALAGALLVRGSPVGAAILFVIALWLGLICLWPRVSKESEHAAFNAPREP